MKVRRNGEKEKLKLAVKKFCNQAAKGCWWMPWHRKAKKDVKPAKSFGESEKA